MRNIRHIKNWPEIWRTVCIELQKKLKFLNSVKTQSWWYDVGSEMVTLMSELVASTGPSLYPSLVTVNATSSTTLLMRWQVRHRSINQSVNPFSRLIKTSLVLYVVIRIGHGLDQSMDWFGLDWIIWLRSPVLGLFYHFNNTLPTVNPAWTWLFFSQLNCEARTQRWGVWAGLC